MNPLQIVVLLLFTVVTFGNVYLLQPGISLSAEVHAAIVSATIAAFFLAFNLKRFADLGNAPDPMVVPTVPAGIPTAAITAAAALSAPAPATVPTPARTE